MKKTFITALALVGVLASMAQTTSYKGKAPQSGEAYYLYNVGTQQFLGTENGTLVLGDGERVLVTLDAVTSEKTPGFFQLTSSGEPWSAQLFGAPKLSQDGKYQEWRVEPMQGKENVYTISSRNTEASASYYVYENSIYDRLAVMPQKPAGEFEAAQWQLISPEEPITPINSFSETDATYTRPEDRYAITKLYRTFNLGAWNTFCSPVDIDATTLKETFGDDVQVAELTGYSRGELKFTTTTQIKAGVPCIINTTMAPAYEECYSIMGDAVYASGAESVEMNGVVFYGTLSVTTPKKSTIYGFNSKTSAIEPISTSTLENGVAGMSGYFVTSNATSEITSWSLDGLTGIGTIDADATPTDIYTIGGQKVKSNATNTEGLQRGIYVVKGRKTTK